MVYLISVSYKWLPSVDQAFCESYTCNLNSTELIRQPGHRGIALEHRKAIFAPKSNISQFVKLSKQIYAMFFLCICY